MREGAQRLELAGNEPRRVVIVLVDAEHLGDERAPSIPLNLCTARTTCAESTIAIEGLVGFLEDAGPTRLTVAAWIVLYCGMREGEICGLKWTGLDFGRGTVGVYGAIGRKEGGTYYKMPKSDSGFREFGMPAGLRPVLLEWRSAVEEECRACGASFDPGLFVIGYPDGSWYSPDVLSHKWTTLSEALGLVVISLRCSPATLPHTTPPYPSSR